MPNLLAQGVELMLIGMGVVFLFLTLLVFATRLMSSLVTRFATVEVVAVPQVTDGISPAEVAAITVALKQHRGES